MTTLGPLLTKYTSRFERLIVVGGILFALVIIGATIAHCLQLREEMRGEAQGQVKTVTRILTQEVNRSLMRTRGLLEQIDDMSSGLKSVASVDYSLRLEAMTRQHFLLREVAIVDRDGRIISSSNPLSIGIDVSGYDFAAAELRQRVRLDLMVADHGGQACSIHDARRVAAERRTPTHPTTATSRCLTKQRRSLPQARTPTALRSSSPAMNSR
jgi:hypothetical protein